MRNAVQQKRIIMNQREPLNIQNQSIEEAVTSVMSYRKATQREKKGRERKNQIEKEETKIKNKYLNLHGEIVCMQAERLCNSH